MRLFKNIAILTGVLLPLLSNSKPLATSSAARNLTKVPTASVRPSNSIPKTLQLDSKSLKALGGGSDRGGGDARKIRSLILESKRQDLIRQTAEVFDGSIGVQSVSNLLAWFAIGRVKLGDAKSQAILDDMLSKGFGKNLAQTKFVMKKSCKDKNGVEKTAVARISAPATDICINPSRFVEEFGPYIQDSDVMSLMMHELSHHYGYEDQDHSFAAAIASEYQKDNERRSQDGSPLNYLFTTN